jgi:hypothetical protein
VITFKYQDEQVDIEGITGKQVKMQGGTFEPKELCC